MKNKILIFALILFCGLIYSAVREVCVPIEDFSGFNSPIEERNDQILWVKTFQNKNGKWNHCKPALWRTFYY